MNITNDSVGTQLEEIGIHDQTLIVTVDKFTDKKIIINLFDQKIINHQYKPFRFKGTKFNNEYSLKSYRFSTFLTLSF